jgi:hypothetical protein
VLFQGYAKCLDGQEHMAPQQDQDPLVNAPRVAGSAEPGREWGVTPRNPTCTRSSPHVPDVWIVFFVASTVSAFDRDEAVPLIKPLRRGVDLERP